MKAIVVSTSGKNINDFAPPHFNKQTFKSVGVKKINLEEKKITMPPPYLNMGEMPATTSSNVNKENNT